MTNSKAANALFALRQTQYGAVGAIELIATLVAAKVAVTLRALFIVTLHVPPKLESQPLQLWNA